MCLSSFICTVIISVYNTDTCVAIHCSSLSFTHTTAVSTPAEAQDPEPAAAEDVVTPQEALQPVDVVPTREEDQDPWQLMSPAFMGPSSPGGGA